MNIHYFKSGLLFVLTLLLNPVAYAGDSVSFNDAWIAEAPPVSKVMAAYMIVSNQGDQAVNIISATSADFSKIEFHQTVHENGMARMKPQRLLVVPAEGQLKLEPGSYHMMLFNPTQPLRAGDTSYLSFTLEDGSEICVEAVVKKSDMASSHEHHNH